MLNRIPAFFSRLRHSTSGHATLLTALSMPMLIGGAGLGVDLSQWYLWKRELQFAVDQAAIAGAWARTAEDTQNTYVTRAEQEFDFNLGVIADFASTPTVRLANFAGGSNNSVIVAASASRGLPFSSMITGDAVNISVFAQASFAEGHSFSSCLIAVDDDEDGAITISGNATLAASCGLAALSTDGNAVIANGNPTVDAGWILSAGGVDDWFDTNTDDVIIENMEGLFDPFENLSPPNPEESQIARTYSCSGTSGTTTADVSTTTNVSYDYFQGSNSGTATYYSYGAPKDNSSTTNTQYGQIVSNSVVAGAETSTSTNWTHVAGKGQNKVWERRTTVINTTYFNVETVGGADAGNLLPGTYDAIHIGCNTTFNTGVYIIDGSNGGGVDITAQYEVTGSGIMFVLKNGAYIKIRGGSKINLTAIQASQLMARGVPAEQANQLAGMLVFEERESEGTSRNAINGNADTVLNGTLYFPVSNLTFSGTASVTNQCLMIAASTITLTGTTDMTSFCPTNSSEDTIVANTQGTVKLVA